MVIERLITEFTPAAAGVKLNFTQILDTSVFAVLMAEAVKFVYYGVLMTHRDHPCVGDIKNCSVVVMSGGVFYCKVRIMDELKVLIATDINELYAAAGIDEELPGPPGAEATPLFTYDQNDNTYTFTDGVMTITCPRAEEHYTVDKLPEDGPCRVVNEIDVDPALRPFL